MSDLLDRVLNALDHCEYEIGYGEMDEVCEIDSNLEYHSGASRWCITHPEWDFVLKFGRFEEVSTDYCEIEAQNYKTAKAYGITAILLPIEEIYKTSAGVKIYKQEKFSYAMCEMNSKQYHAFEKRVKDLRNRRIVSKARNDCHDSYRISREWFARAIQVYGKRFIRAFEAWTRECEVNDLHNGNIGFKNGRPIILDYAGFHG